MAAISTQQGPIDLFPGEQKDELPTMLNVLTILTFIYSGFAFLFAFLIFAIAPFGYENALRTQSAMDQVQMPDFMKYFFGTNQVEAARSAFVNRTPILLISLGTALLCFFGALQMRKLKKRGFFIYIFGDLVPILQLSFLSGLYSLAWIGFAFNFMIALTFIILYATQLKYMK
jgi:hypothetical protein